MRNYIAITFFLAFNSLLFSAPQISGNNCIDCRVTSVNCLQCQQAQTENMPNLLNACTPCSGIEQACGFCSSFSEQENCSACIQGNAIPSCSGSAFTQNGQPLRGSSTSMCQNSKGLAAGCSWGWLKIVMNQLYINNFSTGYIYYLGVIAPLKKVINDCVNRVPGNICKAQRPYFAYDWYRVSNYFDAPSIFSASASGCVGPLTSSISACVSYFSHASSATFMSFASNNCSLNVSNPRFEGKEITISNPHNGESDGRFRYQELTCVPTECNYHAYGMCTDPQLYANLFALNEKINEITFLWLAYLQLAYGSSPNGTSFSNDVSTAFSSILATQMQGTLGSNWNGKLESSALQMEIGTLKSFFDNPSTLSEQLNVSFETFFNYYNPLIPGESQDRFNELIQTPGLILSSCSAACGNGQWAHLCKKKLGGSSSSYFSIPTGPNCNPNLASITTYGTNGSVSISLSSLTSDVVKQVSETVSGIMSSCSTTMQNAVTTNQNYQGYIKSYNSTSKTARQAKLDKLQSTANLIERLASYAMIGAMAYKAYRFIKGLKTVVNVFGEDGEITGTQNISKLEAFNNYLQEWNNARLSGTKSLTAVEKSKGLMQVFKDGMRAQFQEGVAQFKSDGLEIIEKFQSFGKFFSSADDAIKAMIGIDDTAKALVAVEDVEKVLVE